MKLNIPALALTAGLLWALAILFVQALNALMPPYGGEFLVLLSSLYPWYRPEEGFATVLLGMLYGFVDGAIGAAIFAWVYNRLAGMFPSGMRAEG
jgi:hypothetical protein